MRSEPAPATTRPKAGASTDTDPPAVRIWPWPLGLGLLATAGLLSALVVDGWGDAGAWLGLAAPLAIITWHLRRR
jgi:hypothetical protein